LQKTIICAVFPLSLAFKPKA